MKTEKQSRKAKLWWS